MAVVTAATAASPITLYNPEEFTWFTTAELAPVPPNGTPGTTGAPIESNKVVPATEGTPIDEYKPDAATGPLSVLAAFPVASLAGAPINPCKPVAADPVLAV